MKLTIPFAMIAILALLCPARAAEDQSTPKGALKAFALATRAADREKLRACLHAADGREARMADAMVDATAALARLRLVAIAKFGEARARGLEGGVPTEQDIRQIDAGVQKIDGDRATVTLSSAGRPTSEMRLVRVEGAWKIAVGQSLAGKTPQQIDADIALLESTARAVAQVADELNAGKYKTARETVEALSARMPRAGKTATSQPAQ